MNKFLPLISGLLLGALGLSSCTTVANRRDLYWPQKPSGEYYREISDMRFLPLLRGHTQTTWPSEEPRQIPGKHRVASFY